MAPGNDVTAAVRMELAALCDRIIYRDGAVGLGDAKRLYELVPLDDGPSVSLSLTTNSSGGSSSGFAAGVGSVDIRDDRRQDKTRSFEVGEYIRAGQWKVTHRSYVKDHGPIGIGFFGKGNTTIEIEQVMSENKGFRIVYDRSGTPLKLQDMIFVECAIPLPFLSKFSIGWCRWVDSDRGIDRAWPSPDPPR